jgi:hypothetical protein
MACFDKDPATASRDDIVGLLDDIDAGGRWLTAWEIDFIDDMLKLAESADKKDFSPGQREKIVQIYETLV